ncbi:hypothetical protein F4777DRAFT_299768 [Nemania sp. FL0916]|nr:hypothetical protein F4777DRAFT_299768 [Nemania sp. FL0916]
MIPRWGSVWALLFLLLHLHTVVAGPVHLLGRDDPTPTPTGAPAETTAGNGGKDGDASPETTETPNPTKTHTNDMTPTIMVTSATAFPSAINGNSPANNKSSLATPSPIPDGQLPIQPRLTPGWGIAGALLLITGAIYTLIGIKNAWLHTFFSAAFLSGLSVTVLIVYVMTPPVPIAIEGAYVVAAVVSGLILGGAATVFHEITEGLGCLLGGFCVSMWFLTLKPGGLLPSNPSKAIFIAAFSAGCYAFYFSRYTRPYALMGLMSFAGATVTVIGIDCFSRAGLKEFWTYIWDLNNDLFPYAADTYPLTKGIRVEIALTVVFTIVGMISQLKLWKVIQQHRAKKAEAQAEEQRKRDEEEANVGLQIEAQNAREREQWETVYGNQPPRSSVATGDSGVEDVEDEKKDGNKTVVVHQVPAEEDGIEMAELSTPNSTNTPEPAERAADGLMMTNGDDDGGVTIRVANNDEPTANKDVTAAQEQNDKVWVVNGDGEARPSSLMSTRVSQIRPKPPGPPITPLPFKIPNEIVGNESRSSIATFADEDDGGCALREKPSRMSLVNRLSASSGDLIQNLSRRSARLQSPKRGTGEFIGPQFLGSTEELVQNSKRHSDALSIAATVDGLSQDGHDSDDSVEDNLHRTSVPALTVDFGDSNEINLNPENEEDNKKKLKPPNPTWRLETRPTSTAETVGTEILDASAINSSSGDLSKRSSLNQSTKKTESTNEITDPTDMNATEETEASSKPPKSVAPSITSTSVSLTKDRLPSALPRVALSYRTNEWAKHLSAAEAPELEQLQFHEYPERENEEKRETEAAAPVHVEELQQTADGGVPVAPILRSSSSASTLPQVSPPTRPPSRSASYYSSPKAHIPATLAILTSASSEPGAQANSTKPTSPNASQAGHSFRNKGRRTSTGVYSQPIQEENGSEAPVIEQSPTPEGEGSPAPNSIPPSPTAPSPVPGVVSYSSPQTLLGRREMFLRNKSQSQLLTTSPIQENFEYTNTTTTRPVSQMAISLTQDADDIPLSQRKQLMRQSSAASVISVHSSGSRHQQQQRQSSLPSPQIIHNTITAESSRFDSHQPQRVVSRPSQAERDMRLSQFRQSVVADLRVPSTSPSTQAPLFRSASSTSLLGTLGAGNGSAADVSRTIDMQRNALLSQREHEAQRREMERWEKERVDRVFEERMRRGDLVDAHREALRRMQGGVKQG